MNTTLIDFKQIDTDAVAIIEASTNIKSNLQLLEADHPTITESVTQVLAHIADTVERHGQFQIMHVDSVSAFLAGVEALAIALPNATNPSKVANTLRVLSVVSVKDGLVTTNAVPIAQLGASKEHIHDKYRALVKQYVASVSAGEPHVRDLTAAVKKLQVMIDRAMMSAAHEIGQPA